MSNLYGLTAAQLARLSPFFPTSHGRPRADDRRVPIGIILINRNGLRWCDAPREYGPPKTLYNRWKRWSRMGVFTRMMQGLASEAAGEKTIMIDMSRRTPCVRVSLRKYLKAHRTASSLRMTAGTPRLAGRTKGGINTRLHAVADAQGRPISLFVTAGPVRDDSGAAALLRSLPKADGMPADRGVMPIGSEMRCKTRV